MNILITGVHGFVGTNLVQYLAPNHQLYALSSSSHAPMDGVQALYSWDDLSAIPKVDAIIHLAAIAHDIDGKIISQQYNDVNVGLTKKIFDYFIASSAHTFIFISSIKVVTECSTNPINEDANPHPQGYYAQSKHQAEQYILPFIGSDNTFNKSIYILRPSMIYGKGCKGNLRLLYNFVRHNVPWPLGCFDNSRTFTSIDNFCFIVKSLLQNRISSGIYNVCDDQSISTNSLVSLISLALNKKPRIWNIYKPVMTACAKIGECLHLPFNTMRLSKLTDNFLVSNIKIKKALNIEQMPFATHEALTHTIKSFSNDNS